MDEKLKNALLHGSTSIWTDEERQKLRPRDSNEARHKMASEMHSLERSFREESGAMTERVRSRPPLNVRSKEEMAGLLVRHPEAAKQLEQRMKELSASYQEEKAAMTARLEMSQRSGHGGNMSHAFQGLINQVIVQHCYELQELQARFEARHSHVHHSPGAHAVRFHHTAEKSWIPAAAFDTSKAETEITEASSINAIVQSHS
eukprot:g6807.t1